jgi:putative ABC transport system permease protein
MNFWENVSLSLSGLLLNKMRSFLTMLGIIIGIGSVIAIFTVGDSFTNYMSSTLQSFGANNITVSVRDRNSTVSGRGAFGDQAQAKIDDKNKIQSFMIDDLVSEYGSQIDSVSLSNTVGTGKTTIKKKYANLSLIGVNEGYIKANDVQLTEGRFFTNDENTADKKLCVVSDKYLSNLGYSGNVIGQQVDIKVNDLITNYTIIGVYKYTQSSTGMTTTSDQDLSTNVYIPINVANRIAGSTRYQSFSIVTSVGVNSTDFATTVQTYMNNFYSKNLDYTISASSMESLVSSMSSLINTLKLAISAIAAIALLVGGIGVMNIMLVSITERTKEIGTRKALGAKNSGIRIQFVTESALICFIGGIIGVLFGTGLGLIVSTVMGYSGSASISNIIVAVGFSIAIGIFFGYYPANKAAKLDPIEALRYE